MRKSICYIAFSLLTIQVTYSQTSKWSTADLKGAQRIQVNTDVASISSPKGFGQVNEFPVNSFRPPYLFKTERNTRWFLLSIPYSGLLTFNLTPYKLADDYDWMLFKRSPGLEQEIYTATVKPVRTNNSRNDPRVGSVTGLREGYENMYTTPGPNSSFSKPVHVIKGDQYYLVIDNIYEKGEGFNLRVDLKPTFHGTYQVVEGYVRDKKTNRPLNAEILFEDDSTAFLISKTRSNSAGYYTTVLPASRPINGTAIHPGYLYGTNELFLNRADTAPVNFLLDSIQKGNKVILFNIHFQPNRDIILPHSSSELDRLLAFLKRETNWAIKIIGHSNSNVFADASYLQKLSFNRAVTVKRFLVKNGIPSGRISCIGMGGKQPLIETSDPVEGLKNLRVEILLEKKL
jgi:hypothetical protein